MENGMAVQVSNMGPAALYSLPLTTKTLGIIASGSLEGPEQVRASFLVKPLAYNKNFFLSPLCCLRPSPA